MKTKIRLFAWLPAFLGAVLFSDAALQPLATSPRPSTTASGDSFAPILSADGRWVVFLSAANNLVANDNPAPHLDVFLHDLNTTNTLLVSVGLTGIGGGNADAHSASISSNGQFIVFESAAGNLVSNDTNGVTDVFVRNILAGTTTLVSVSGGGTPGNGASSNPLISHDGRWVIFESSATNLVAGDTNGVADVFARDLTTSVTMRVSDGVMPVGLEFWAAGSPAISADGRFVAFAKTPTNYPTGPVSRGDVFLRDLQSGTTTWVSANMSNQFPGLSFQCANPSVNADGRYVSFLAIGQSYYPSAQVYRRDLLSGTNALVLTNAPVQFVPRMSADGRFIALAGTPVGAAAAGLHVWDGSSEVLRTICSDGPGYGSACAESPVVSATGGTVAYVTSNGVFIAHPVTLLTSGVSLNTNGALRPVATLSEPALSDDGQRVAFETAEPDLVADDLNQASDVFVFDVPTATTRLVSRRHPGLPSVTAAGQLSLNRPAVSAGGRFVAFMGEDKSSVPQDTNGLRDIFVHDLMTGTTTLAGAGPFVSITNGMLTTNVLQPKPVNLVLSADGRSVAFEGAADFNAPGAVYYQDRLVGFTTLVSQQSNGLVVDGAAPAMTADGRFVAFQSRASAGLMDGLGTLDWFGSNLDVFIRDMQATNISTRTVSVAFNGMAGTGESRNPVFSPDGRWISFQSTSVQLVSNSFNGPVNGAYQLFARNLVTARTRLVSFKPDGSALPLGGTNPVFSANSRYLFFQETNNVNGTAIYRHDLSSLVRVTNDVVCTNCAGPATSADGRWVVYESRAPGAFSQVFLKDLLTGSASLISSNGAGTGGGNGGSFSPQISHDGRYVVFASQAGDLVANDTNGVTDVFVVDRWTGTRLLTSINVQGAASGNGPSIGPVLAADGRTVAFLSYASDLIYGDLNDSRDVFVLHLGGADSDADGMEDDWEMAYFGTLARDGLGDFDGDGVSDLTEFRSGTDPTNTGSVFRILMLTAPATGSKTLLWASVPGKTYRVQYADEIGSHTWTDLPVPPVTAVGTTSTQIDPFTSPARRFYRVVLQ